MSENQKDTQQNHCFSFFEIETMMNSFQNQRKTDAEDDKEERKKRWDTYENLINNFVVAKETTALLDNVPKLDSGTLSWIDSKALTQCIKNVSEDRDRSHTRALNNIIWDKQCFKVNDFSIFDTLDKELPNFKQVTNFYRGAFSLNQSRPVGKYTSPRPILLLGKPGIGKTHYAKRLAQLLGVSYRFFDATAITGSWVLSGNNATWRGADAGLIFKEMAKSPTMSPMLLIDEIDKLKDHMHSPFPTFHQLYEKENARNFYDEFLDITFDASQMIHVLTANDAKSIPDSLLSRFNVFDIQSPDKAAMRIIIQAIYQNIISESELFTLTLEEQEVEKLVTLTPREVYQVLSNNIFDQAGEHLGKKHQSLSIITDKYKKPPIGF